MDISRRAMLESCFPGLGQSEYEITSPPSPEYNCIAWAAGENDVWWEPDPADIYYWPSNAPREYTLDSYVQAYAILGFRTASDELVEPGVEKIALFARDGQPQHAARQLCDGTWTSKCGQLEDISHPLHALEGDEYGAVAIILARPKAAT